MHALHEHKTRLVRGTFIRGLITPNIATLKGVKSLLTLSYSPYSYGALNEFQNGLWS